MKRLIICTGLFLFLSAAQSYAEEIIIPSTIKEVILFSNQALIKKEASSKVSAGMQYLCLETTANHIDTDSVSAKVFGSGEVYSVQLKQKHLTEAPQETTRELQKKIEIVVEDIELLSAKLTMLKQKEKFINSISDFSNISIPSELKISLPSITNLTELLQFIEINLNEINTQTAAITKNKRDLQKKLEALQQELNDIGDFQNKTTKIIEIAFNSQKEQTVTIEASYVVKRAYWQPLYKIDVPVLLDKAELTMFSQIRQISGEDWEDVTVTISNATPLQGTQLPMLESWYLDIFKKKVYSKAKAQSPEMMNYFTKNVSDGYLGEDSDEEGILLSIPEEAQTVVATSSQLPLSFEYLLPQKITVPSKDEETLLPLLQEEITGDFYYYAVPQLNNLTFLVCSAKLKRDLISGNLNVYFDKRFVGSTYLQEKQAGEDFKVTLGADREVKVKREKIVDKRKETSFFGKIDSSTIVKDMTFKLTIENLKDKAINLQLIDSIPVAVTDKIKVENVTISKEPSIRNYLEKEGVLFWDLDLKAKSTIEIVISFTIAYPKDEIIKGIR